jgi:release factor glutamine methyltransferase
MTVDPLARAGASATMRSELDAAFAALAAAGIENPRLEARLLLRHVLGLSMETLIGYPEQAVAEDDRTALRLLVARRVAREPLAYILGEREFWSLPFRVTPDTLIPRPDSETLIEAALEHVSDRHRPLRILDLGTGSGCLLLALLAELPAASGVGVDLSAAALNVARDNALVLGLADRAAWVQGNWSDAISGTFDLVVANPPYVAEAEISCLAPEVTQFEPRLALNGGPDGLDCLRAFVPRLAQLGTEDSIVLIEIGADQAAPALALLIDQGLQEVKIINDLSGNSRCIAAKPGRNKKKAWNPYSSRLLSEAARGRQAAQPMGASHGTDKPADIPHASGCPQVGLDKLRTHDAAQLLLNGGMFAARTLGMR